MWKTFWGAWLQWHDFQDLLTFVCGVNKRRSCCKDCFLQCAWHYSFSLFLWGRTGLSVNSYLSIQGFLACWTSAGPVSNFLFLLSCSKLKRDVLFPDVLLPVEGSVWIIILAATTHLQTEMRRIRLFHQITVKKVNTLYLWSPAPHLRSGQWGLSAVSGLEGWTAGTSYDLLPSDPELQGYSPLGRSYLK